MRNTYVSSIIGAIIITSVLLPSTVTWAGSDTYKQMLTQFTAQQNWADDSTRELFTFIYYNVPDSAKSVVLQKYKELFGKVSSAVTKDRLLQMTDSMMPKEMGNVKPALDAEIQKFISYQNSKNK